MQSHIAAARLGALFDTDIQDKNTIVILRATETGRKRCANSSNAKCPDNILTSNMKEAITRKMSGRSSSAVLHASSQHEQQILDAGLTFLNLLHFVSKSLDG